MKNVILIISGCLFLFVQSFSQGTWTQKANFGGSARSGAVGFSIYNKGYIGTGGAWNTGTYFSDFWEFNPATNVWTQKASFAGGPRAFAVGFSIGARGYIGTGVSNITQSGPIYWQDFWEYDPTTNAWTQKTNYPGDARENATGFSIGNKGYITTGQLNYNPYSNDFWEWDQATDTWTQKTNFPIATRDLAVGFSIGTKGYIATGESNPYGKDLWEWDQATDQWSQKANFPGTARCGAVGFSIGTKGYVGTGFDNGNGDGLTQDFYEWDQSTNIWSQQTSFPGNARNCAVGFSIGNKGYLGTGYNHSPFEKDFWEFVPEFASSVKETESVIDLSVYPNPGSIFTVSVTFSGLSGPFDLKISNEEGKTVYFEKIKETSSSVSKQIDLSTLPKGIYFVELKCGKQRSVKKIILQ